MNLSRSEIHTLRSERAAYAKAIRDIREATGTHAVPLGQLAGVLEDLLSTLAERQIQHDVDQPVEPEPVYDDWAPEDTVLPAPVKSCRGCIGLAEIDGRLMCMSAASQHYGGGITWPGPGCVWASAGDQVYGGGRG